MATPEDPFSSNFRMPRHFWQPVVFSTLFFVIALGAVFHFISLAADRENAQARGNSLHLAETAMGTLRQDLIGRAVDYAWWNDMVTQAAKGIDPAWAETNIGTYMQTQFGYTGTYVLDPGNRTVYFSTKSPGLPAEGMTFLGPAAPAFLARLRPVPAVRAESASAFVAWQGKVYLIAASSVTPEEPTSEQVQMGARPVLVFFRALDDDLMASLGGRFLLVDFRLRDTAGIGPAVGLEGVDGGETASVTWTQDRPGDALFKDLAVSIGAMTLVLAVAAVVLAYIWSRTAIAANLAKSRFLAKMSHELLTPLNPIIGFSQVMGAEVFGPLDPRYKEYADGIHRSGVHLQSVVQGVLDFSRIEAGELRLVEAPIDLANLVRDLPPITVYRPGARGSDNVHALPLRTEFAGDLPRFMGDERCIRQILINVLFNAAKFSDGKDVTLRAALDGGAIRIEVEDQGIGIAPQDISKAFEPFVQLAPTGGRTHNRNGAGIGLSICRELIQMHGGTLDLESELGRGTKVIIRFPSGRTVAASPASEGL
ncbi:MAG: hypothetical protein COW30_03250 [Rhodospirillales bacterium CG15_BIG_FIL_POST_REV_8_21_14_020_66_15]|nr:MAG: hypothetical protein COW30_03250 [Rhodospirillales bacterium CG15_BIG_FIL_POST_REV_8_21_14_020_66_15]